MSPEALPAFGDDMIVTSGSHYYALRCSHLSLSLVFITEARSLYTALSTLHPQLH